VPCLVGRSRGDLNLKRAPARLADLGTLVVLTWSGEAPDGTDRPGLPVTLLV